MGFMASPSSEMESARYDTTEVNAGRALQQIDHILLGCVHQKKIAIAQGIIGPGTVILVIF